MPKRAAVDLYTGPLTPGLDVSKWQGPINWLALPADLCFVFIRSGDGTSIDQRFVENWEGARSVSLAVGNYRYLRADRDGSAQAELDLGLLAKVGYLPGEDLPPVLDLEAGSRKDLPGGVFTDPSSPEYMPLDMFVDESLEYLADMEKGLGVRPIIYTGQAFHWWLSQGRPELAKKFARYPLWVPSYGKTKPELPVDQNGAGFPWPTWTFWQYTASGRLPGIIGNVDLNYFRGDEDVLSAFIKQSFVVASQDPEPEDDTHAEEVSGVVDHASVLSAVQNLRAKYEASSALCEDLIDTAIVDVQDLSDTIRHELVSLDEYLQRLEDALDD